MNLIPLLENIGLDSATAGTVASMAATKPISEVSELLKSILGDSPAVNAYIKMREQTELKKLEIKADTHNGTIKDGKVVDGVTRNGVVVRTTPKKVKSNKNVTSNTDKLNSLKDLEAALKSLSVDAPNREPCHCLGSIHGLLDVAPNCLQCGRIICNKENLGPCLFCKTPLITNERIEQIMEILESQKLELMSSMSKKVLKQAGITASKSDRESSMKARAHLNQLLTYQSEDAVRTRIIDQASEVDFISMNVNRWATPQEQAEQLYKQQQQLRRLEHDRKVRSGMGRKVLSIDVHGNKIYTNIEDAEYESDEENVDITSNDTDSDDLEHSQDTNILQFYDSKIFNRKVDGNFALQLTASNVCKKDRFQDNWRSAEKDDVSDIPLIRHDDEIIY